MNKQQKADAVAELKGTLDRVVSLVLADFRGLTVAQVNGLRREIRVSNCSYRVVKNTLVRRAISGTAMDPLTAYLRGPTAIAYSFSDPVAPAKVLDSFAEKLEKLTLKAGYVSGEVLDASGVKQLAKMKGRDELRAELLMVFIAPAQEFVRLTAAGPLNLLYALQARERQLSEA